MSSPLISERFVVVEDCRDGTFECPIWYERREDAEKEAKKQQKGLRDEEHAMLVCEVLATYEYEEEAS